MPSLLLIFSARLLLFPPWAAKCDGAEGAIRILPLNRDPEAAALGTAVHSERVRFTGDSVVPVKEDQGRTGVTSYINC